MHVTWYEHNSNYSYKERIIGHEQSIRRNLLFAAETLQ